MKINYKSIIVRYTNTFISIISTISCSIHPIFVRCSSAFQTVVGNFERDREREKDRESGYMRD